MEEEKKDLQDEEPRENPPPPAGEEKPSGEDRGGESPSRGSRKEGSSEAEKSARKRSRVSWKRAAVQCEEELARTKAELEEAREKVLRRIAEFENYRRRVEEEKQALREEAKALAFGEVLHLFDMLDMALEAAEKGGSVEDLVQGLRLVQDQWKALLGSAGVEEVPGKGKPFDPLYHDAVQVHPTEEVPPGVVTHVLRKGYKLKNRVLRHAQVVVSERPGSAEKEEEEKKSKEPQDSPRKEGTPPPEPEDRAEPEGPEPQED